MGHQNLVQSCIDYFEYRTYDTDPIGGDWMKITNEDYSYFCMKYYYKFRRLREAGVVNPRPTSTIFSYKRHYPVNNLKRPIKCNHEPPKFGTATPLCNDTKLVTSVNTDNNFTGSVHGTIVN